MWQTPCCCGAHASKDSKVITGTTIFFAGEIVARAATAHHIPVMEKNLLSIG
jgi:hypothetical protein